MKICPICKREFEDFLDYCPQCALDQHAQHEDVDIEWLVLTTVSNDIEFEMVARLLEGAGIPAVRRVNGIDGYLTVIIGIPLAGVDVLVPSDRLVEAERILNSSIDDENF